MVKTFYKHKDVKPRINIDNSGNGCFRISEKKTLKSYVDKICYMIKIGIVLLFISKCTLDLQNIPLRFSLFTKYIDLDWEIMVS